MITFYFAFSSYQLDVISEAVHGGTHLDAPRHFNPDGWSVSEIPLNRMLYVPVAVVDIVEQAFQNSSYKLSAADLQQWEERHGPLPDGGLLMVRSGWSRVSRFFLE